MTVNFQLQPKPCTIKGRVTDSVTGSGIVSAYVYASGPSSGSDYTDSSGYYAISSLNPGSYSVTASKSGYYSQTKSTSVSCGGSSTVNFQLQPKPCTIKGMVTDSVTGSGISGATVSASGPTSRSTTTDSSGYYSLSNLNPGSYSVTASKSGYHSQTKSTTVSGGGTSTLNFQLQPCVDLLWTNIWTNPSSPTGGQNARIYWQVKNRGTCGTSTSFTNYFYINDQYAGQGTNYGLGAGSAYNWYLDRTLDPGYHVIAGKADVYNAVPEYDENNNYYSKKIWWKGADLIVVDIWWIDAYGNRDTAITSGQPFTVYFQIKNNGDATATGTFTTYLFVEGWGTAAGSLDSLNSGSTYTWYAENVYVSTTGSSKLRVVVDYHNAIAEANKDTGSGIGTGETNNQKIKTASVQIASWTVITYLSSGSQGGTDLSTYVDENVNRIRGVGSSTQISLVTLADRSGNGNTHAYFFKPNQLVEIELNDIKSSWTNEVDVGDPSTLTAFSTYMIKRFHANHYALILFDHGGALDGVIWDDVHDHALQIDEIGDALQSIKQNTGVSKLDIFGLDACLMGMVEMAYEIQNCAYVFIGSEKVEYGCPSICLTTSSWRYNEFLSFLRNNPTTSRNALATRIVDTYVDHWSSAWWHDGSVTLSAIDLNQIENLANKISSLADLLKQNMHTYRSEIIISRGETEEYDFTWMVDLYHFTERVHANIPDSNIRSACVDLQNALNTAVIHERHNTRGNDISVDHAHGLSIWFPDSQAQYTRDLDELQKQYNGYYENDLDFAAKNWDEFLYYFIYNPNTAPVVVFVSPSGGDAWSGVRTIIWTGADDDYDWVSYDIYLSTDGGSTWHSLFSYSFYFPENPTPTTHSDSFDTADYEDSTNCKIKIEYDDHNGGSGTVYSDIFTIDNTPPTTGIFHSPGSSRVSLIAFDATSGVYESYYRIDGGSWKIYTGEFTIPPGETHKIESYSRDKAGNDGSIVYVLVHRLIISISPSGYGTTYPSPGTYWHDSGTSVSVSESPNPGYGFDYWDLDGNNVGSEESYTVKMHSPHILTAIFKIRKYSINLSSRTTDNLENVGKIVWPPLDNGEEYELPTTIEKPPAWYIVWAVLPSEYEDSYTFLRWESSGGITVDQPNSWATSIDVSGDGSLTAVWELRELNIKKIVPDGSTYRRGDHVTFSITVHDQYNNPVENCLVWVVLTPPSGPQFPLSDFGNGQYVGYYELPVDAEPGYYSASISTSLPRTAASTPESFKVDVLQPISPTERWMGNVGQSGSVYFKYFVPYVETTLPTQFSVFLGSYQGDILYLKILSPSGETCSAISNDYFKIVTVQNPQFGTWTIEVFGHNVAEDGVFISGCMFEFEHESIFLESGDVKYVLEKVTEQVIINYVTKTLGFTGKAWTVVGLVVDIIDFVWEYKDTLGEIAIDYPDLMVESVTTDGQSNVGHVTFRFVVNKDTPLEEVREYLFSLSDEDAKVTIVPWGKVEVEAIRPSGYTFDHWEVVQGSVTIENIYVAKTDMWLYDPFNSPHNIVRAVYKKAELELEISAHSPVYLMVTDPNGLRCGFDPVGKTVLNEIPNAWYSGLGTQPQVVSIANPVPGVYIIDAYGIDAGFYSVTLSTIDSSGTTIDSLTWTGTAEPEHQYTQGVQLEPDGSLKDPTPPTTTATTVTPDTTTVDPTLTATVVDALSTVVAAEYFIDTLGTSGTGVPLSATDGTFDELSEEVIATISILELSHGEHTVYVHGKDSFNNWGDFDSCTFFVIKTYSLTVKASPLDASGGTFLVTYTLHQITYVDEEYTTPWTTEVDVGSTVTISSPQEIIDVIPDDGTRYSYLAGATTFTMDSDKIITLDYKTQYYLTMSTNFGTISPKSAWFDADTTLTIEATAPSVIEGERYVWLGWAGIGDISYSGMDNPATDAVTMNSPVSETASWRHEFRLTITTNFGATDPPVGEHWYEAGTIVTISATPPSTIDGERYVWNGWTGTGIIAYTGADNPASITLNSPITETASWTHEYYLTTSTNFGSVSPTSNWFKAGSVVEISATPPSVVTGEQYVWNGWSGTGSGSYSGTDNPSSVIMNAPITEIASWTHQFYLEIEVVNEIGTDISSVVTIAGQGWYGAETETELTAPQDVEFALGSRYDFRSWTGDVSSTSNTILVIMTAPNAVTAHYMTQYYLTVNNGGHGTASGEGWYDSGVSATFSISPTIVYEGVETRYVFTQWSGDSTSTNPSDTILMDGPKTVTANWKTQYQVTFEQTGSGATTYVTYIVDTDPIEAVPFSIWAKAGSTLTFSYDEIVNDGEPTRYVLVNVDHTSPFTVDAPITITATYKTQHYLTVEHSPIDSILDGHQTGQDYYDADSIATVTADLHVDIVTGESRYEFDHWSGDGSGASTTTTVIMSAPKTATANYKIQYYITVTSAHDSPTPSAWVNAGSDFTALVTSPTEIVPNDHQWVCTGYSVDGGAYQAGTSHTFTNVQAAHSIDFTWKQQFWIQVNSSHDSPTPSQWIDEGGSVTVSVTSPADDDGMGTRYRCTGYTLDSNPPVTDGSTSYTFEDIQDAHIITFNWITQYRLTVTSDHDSPDPTVGEHWYDTATTIAATVTSPADESNGIRYRSTGWTGTGSVPASGTSTSVTFTLGMPSTLTWNWIIQYNLVVKSDHDAPTPAVGEHWYDSGTSILAGVSSPADDDGMGTRYRCTGWTLAKDSTITSGSEISVSFSIDAPSTLTWNWIAQYYLTMSTNFGDVSPLSDWYDAGADVIILATPPDVIPNERYVWNGWSGTGIGSYSGTDNPATITMYGPISETASWTHQYYIIVSSAHDTPTPSAWVDQGSDFTASVTSPTEVVVGDHQWVCTGFSVDGGPAQTGASYTFLNVQAPHTIAFNWKKQFWIQVNSDHDNPTPSAWVDQGDSFTASVTSPADIEPDHHQWVCSGFTVDGGAPQPGTSYTFINVQAPHTIVFNWWEQFWVTLMYTGDTVSQYSDPASLSASLTVTETGQPLQGKTIAFTIGTQSVTTTTNEQGIAATTITMTQPASDLYVIVEFAGDTVYLPRTVEEPFILNREDVAVDYTGDTVVPTTAKTINLRATVFDSADGWWGDLTKIRVTF
ncbi:MAG: carboxypeptidase regulatory-like domain-containing protein, partial [Desulfobacterales bacterium]|nr:carboxypeptidase regulatory-like domain-containing protein [Desulfobacterales bacterium]